MATHKKYTTTFKDDEITAHNRTFAIGGVSCSADSLVVAKSFLLRIKFSGKNLVHRKSAERYRAFKKNAMKRNLLEKYEENNVLRALVNFIPNIGGSLDILLSIKGSKWREERLKTFLADLDKRVGEIEDQEVIKKISESEEFYDLIVLSMNSIIKTRHRKKIECYSNILLNSLVLPKSKISSELLIATLDAITIDEIEYLSELKNNSNEIKIDIIEGKKIIWAKYLKHLQQTGKENIPNESVFDFNIDLIWKLLNDRNLILTESKKEFKYLDYTYSTSMQSMQSSVLSTEKITYTMSDFGKEFINWVLK